MESSDSPTPADQGSGGNASFMRCRGFKYKLVDSTPSVAGWPPAVPSEGEPPSEHSRRVARGANGRLEGSEGLAVTTGRASGRMDTSDDPSASASATDRVTISSVGDADNEGVPV